MSLNLGRTRVPKAQVRSAAFRLSRLNRLSGISTNAALAHSDEKAADDQHHGHPFNPRGGGESPAATRARGLHSTYRVTLCPSHCSAFSRARPFTRSPSMRQTSLGAP